MKEPKGLIFVEKENKVNARIIDWGDIEECIPIIGDRLSIFFYDKQENKKCCIQVGIYNVVYEGTGSFNELIKDYNVNIDNIGE